MQDSILRSVLGDSVQTLLEANNLRVMFNQSQSDGMVHPLLEELEHKEMVLTKKPSSIPLVMFGVSILIHPG